MCAIFEFAETTSLWVFVRVNNLELLPGFPGNSRNHGDLRGATSTLGRLAREGRLALQR